MQGHMNVKSGTPLFFSTPSQPTRLQYQRKQQNRLNPPIIQERVERWLQMQIIKHIEDGVFKLFKCTFPGFNL